MTTLELAQEIAKGLVETGIEGGFGSVSCSTAGDYPSMGISQWEGIDGGRGDTLLSYIDGGEDFVGRTYSDILESGEMEILKELLDSEQGHEAQLAILTDDCRTYVDYLMDIEGFTDCRCIIYAGMWCPTSHHVVRNFLRKRKLWGYDICSLETLYQLFETEYARAAGCSAYAEGYSARAFNTYDYVANLDLSEYEVEAYDE